MNFILRLFWFFAKRYIRGQAILRVKRQGVIAYIHALQGARRILLAAILGFFAFHVIVLAGFGALVTGMFLLNLEPRTILIILFGIFSAAFFIPITALTVILSERFWYKMSGAEKMVADLDMKSDSKAA